MVTHLQQQRPEQVGALPSEEVSRPAQPLGPFIHVLLYGGRVFSLACQSYDCKGAWMGKLGHVYYMRK